MKILIACEESQAITKEYRKRGLEAYSCDIKDETGGYPQWHIKGCALKEAYSGKYSLMIAHPPCTFLSVAGAWAMYNKDGSINTERLANQKAALDFVRALMLAPIKHIAIENPISVISSAIRPPEQIIQPYQFGHKATKSTCLWLKNLPLLKPTKIVEKGEFKEYTCKKTGKKKRQTLWMYNAVIEAGGCPNKLRTLRSKTFQGIAEAIADQWGENLKTLSIQKTLF